ncbi:hypothetical protein HNR39_001889 [Glaciimonas immobilis]|uniref:Uncharacterized protein n=1 Tax=Glaciimonas immobilis TaxID=728004 RepID=A0A840RNW8_9BURK|nr:hypothetical protein [Glaciimonas immobilis]
MLVPLQVIKLNNGVLMTSWAEIVITRNNPKKTHLYLMTSLKNITASPACH